MPLTQSWPTPVIYPEYKYKYTFVPAEVDLDGDPNDPNNPPTSFSELFKDVTLNPEIVETDNGYSVKGDGVLDKLMETAQLHLDAQFQSNRIKQENYAEEHLQMYLGTLQMFSASFIQFEIEKMRLKAQVALENKKMELELQIARERNESSERQATEQRDSQEKMHDEDIVSREKLAANEIVSREKIATEQIESQETLHANSITSQKLMQEKEITSREQIAADQITSQELMNTANNTSAETQNTARITSQNLISANQITAQTAMNTANNTSAEKQNTDRIVAQAALVAAQVQTEYEKKNLHRRQIESFDEDFKQKLLKINMDAWAVGFSVARDNPDIRIIPAPMKAAAIDSLYNTKILPDIDNNTYYRAKSTLGTVNMEH